MKKLPEEDSMGVSFKNTFFVLGTVFGFLLLLHLGQKVFVPVAFALLMSFILYPIASKLEKKGIRRVWSTIWTVVFSVLFVLGLIYIFSSQIIKIIKQFDDFAEKLSQLTVSVAEFVNTYFPIFPTLDSQMILQKSREWLGGTSTEVISGTLNTTSAFITGLILTIIYTFLILLYRRGLKDAFIHFATPEKRPVYSKMLTAIQKVGQQYIMGMFILIVILGLLNSTGLFLLGIDYPLFFGFLAAFLSVIPYVGTTLGGAIPTVYALINYDSIWYAIGVILIFWFIQFVESNYLNPKIVGGNLNLNALVAIIALIMGGVIWGIAGMVLFRPYMSVFKVICKYYEPLRPVALLLDDNLFPYKEKNKGP